LTDAFSFHPVYYNFDGEEETNYYERGLQNSRGFRALKVWLVLRQVGAEGHIRMIREDILLAKRLFDILSQNKEIEVVSQHLSITTFRYKPTDIDGSIDQEYLNKLNQTLLNRLQSGGEVFPSNAVLNGNFLLRVCIVNFRTSLSDIELLPDIILREGRPIHDQMLKERSVAS
jgi:glutamate/tyrosine decarboxylase-like PLP-dependent enzyme